jgi:hypothetical protein
MAITSSFVSNFTNTGAEFFAAGTVNSAFLQDQIETRARQIANDILAQQALQSQTVSSGRIFTRFDIASDVVENQQTTVTTGLFTGNAATLTAMFTSSTQPSASKQYYYSVYNDTSAIAESQFAVAWGNRNGSGSSAQGTLNDSPSRAVYSQYRLLLLTPDDNTFTFANSTNSDSIYVINFDRARLKEKLNPGNWQFNLAELNGKTSGVPNSAYTGSNVAVSGSNKIIQLIDDSSTVTTTNLGNSGRIYNIVSGSITNGIYKQGGAPVYYGLAYPDMGILVLNGDVLNASASFNTVTGSNVAGDNAIKLFKSIAGSIAVPGGSVNAPQARNEQTVTSTHYFVRMKNAEYNFSNNPTFITGSVGEFKQPTFIGDPKVYVTTIGLYNDRQELLAVAKLSQPIQKSFNSEVLIKCKIDY